MITIRQAFILLLLAFADLTTSEGSYIEGSVASEQAHAFVHQQVIVVNDPARSNLRAPNAKARIVSKDDRDLQDAPSTTPVFSHEFVVPFRLVWNMAFSEDAVLVEPTEEEYNALFYATLRWLLASANEVYSNETLFQIRSFDMTLFGSNFNATDPFPSTVVMEIQCHFLANNETDIPPNLELLVTISGSFNRTVFLEDYLKLEDPTLYPELGIFKQVEELRYNIVPSALPAIVSNTTTADEEMVIASLAVLLEFRFQIGFGIPDREPTSDEYEGYLEATSRWFTDILEGAYPRANDTHPAFHGLSSSIEAVFYDSTSDLPHSIQIWLDLSFLIPSSGKVKLPTVDSLLRLWRAQDLKNYEENYIQTAQPELSLFTGARAVAWQYLETGYTFAVSRSNTAP